MRKPQVQDIAWDAETLEDNIETVSNLALDLTGKE